MLVHGGYAVHTHVPDDPDPDFPEPRAMTNTSTGLLPATSTATMVDRENNPPRLLDCMYTRVF